MTNNLKLNVFSNKSIENFASNVQEHGEVDEEFLLENIDISIHALDRLNEDEYNSERAKGLLHVINVLLFQVTDEHTVNKIIAKCTRLCDIYGKLINYNLNEETRDIEAITRLFLCLKKLSRYSKSVTKTNVNNGIVEKALRLLNKVNFVHKSDFNYFGYARLLTVGWETLANDRKINNMDDINLFNYDNDYLRSYHAIVAFLYSTSRWSSGKNEINKHDGLQILLNQLKLLEKCEETEKNEMILIVKSRIILTLTFLVTNNQVNEIVQTIPDDIINALVASLKQMIDNGKANKYRRLLNTKYYVVTSLYYFASDVLCDLIQICYNDKIKNKLIHLDIIDAVKELMMNGNDIEIEKSCELLCYLSFSSYVAQYLRSNSMIKKWIEDVIRKTNRLETKRFCQQIIELVYSFDDTIARIPQNKHVMISYHDKYENECTEINDRLKQKGYLTWMQNWNQYDRDDGELYKAMANAVKNASVVLICYSEEYRYDNNCRYEASYAASLGKPQIMIKMQENYQPDNWLGLLAASKLYVEYYSSNEACRYDRLFGQLESLLGPPPTHTLNTNSSSTNNQNLSSLNNVNAVNWTHEEVKKWLIANKLENLINVFNNIDGKCLKDMWDLKQTNFTSFYADLNDKINYARKYYKIRFQEKIDFYVHLQKLFN